MTRITIFNEFVQERMQDDVKSVYPDGIHVALGAFLSPEEDFSVTYATQDMPEHGLTQEVLQNTDVLLWWAHLKHEEVDDKVVQRVFEHVNAGMGLIVLHSAHASKIFSRLMGTQTLDLRWREDDELARHWVVNKGHPIAQGVGDYFEVEHDETYGEPFAIPEPDELVFICWYPGGEVFRSGCCFRRGQGRIFYFQPGHETIPVYHNNEMVQKVIKNAIRWAHAPYRFTYTVAHTQKLN